MTKKMSRWAYLFALVVLATSCSNRLGRRLSATYLCDTKAPIGSFEFNEDELNRDGTPKGFVEDPGFSLSQKMRTIQAYITVYVPDSTGGEDVVLSYANGSGGAFDISALCAARIKPESKTENPFEFKIPLSIDGDNKLVYQKVTVEFGYPKQEDRSDFLKSPAVKRVLSTNEGAETPYPSNYQEFFNNSGSDVKVYKERDGGNKNIRYIHFQNAISEGRVRVDITK